DGAGRRPPFHPPDDAVRGGRPVLAAALSRAHAAPLRGGVRRSPRRGFLAEEPLRLHLLRLHRGGVIRPMRQGTGHQLGEVTRLSPVFFSASMKLFRIKPGKKELLLAWGRRLQEDPEALETLR